MIGGGEKMGQQNDDITHNNIVKWSEKIVQMLFVVEIIKRRLISFFYIFLV